MVETRIADVYDLTKALSHGVACEIRCRIFEDGTAKSVVSGRKIARKLWAETFELAREAVDSLACEKADELEKQAGRLRRLRDSLVEIRPSRD